LKIVSVAINISFFFAWLLSPPLAALRRQLSWLLSPHFHLSFISPSFRPRWFSLFRRHIFDAAHYFRHFHYCRMSLMIISCHAAADIAAIFRRAAFAMSPASYAITFDIISHYAIIFDITLIRCHDIIAIIIAIIIDYCHYAIIDYYYFMPLLLFSFRFHY
jgi:hypothetical protein